MDDEKSFETLKHKYGGAIASYREMSLVEKIKKVILNPSEFFEKIKGERGVRNAFIFFAVISLISLIVNTLNFYFKVPLFSAGIVKIIPEFSLTFSLIVAVVLYVFSLVLSFLGSAIMHIFVKLFKGKGSYSETYKSIIYGSTPLILFSWISLSAIYSLYVAGILSIIFILYSLYLGITGISKLHETSFKRGIAIFLTAVIVIGISVGIIAGGVSYYFVSRLFAPLIEKNATFEASDLTLSYKAATLKDSTICDKILENSLWKDSCYYYVAMLKKDISLCSKAVTSISSSKEECELVLSAINSNDNSMCDNITSPVYNKIANCHINFAIATRNFRACEKITVESFKNRCYYSLANIMKDSSICDNIIQSDDKKFCMQFQH
jgi:hypothetical protein